MGVYHLEELQTEKVKKKRKKKRKSRTFAFFFKLKVLEVATRNFQNILFFLGNAKLQRTFEKGFFGRSFRF